MALADQVLAANLALVEHGLVSLTWGNASGVDRESARMVIKPSGIPYEALRTEDLAVVDLQTGAHLGGGKPSTDTPTHLALYREFEQIGGIVHTHSTWATAWAQARRVIPLLGTTHADLSAHPIPLTRQLTPEEVGGEYEESTGRVIIEAMAGHGPDQIPCVLVRGHAPFCWGETPAKAVDNAVTLEQVARMAWLTVALEPDAPALEDHVRDKHFERKHGPHSYYGQRS